MTRFVSLFAGINVGGNRVVRMDALKTLHEELGLRDVATYIQSGNVVFSSDDGVDSAQLARRIEERFAEQFGFFSHVMVRSEEELSGIIERNPFRDALNAQEKELKWVMVVFLTAQPEQAAWADLVNSYAGPEELHLIGQELYIYYAEGIGRSKLNPALKKLKTPGTGRNWNTVLRLRQMM